MVDPRQSLALLVAGVFLIVVSACSTASLAPPMESPRVTAGAPPAPLVTSAGSPVSLRRQGVVFELPEAELWRLTQRGTFTLARHDETASELWVKRWYQGERVSAATCAHQAQLWQPAVNLPDHPPERTLTLQHPTGYHTVVSLHGWSNGETWHGQLTAHGAAIRDCLTYVYRTRAPASSLGKAVVNQRLRALLESLRTLHVQDPTDLPKSPSPSSPTPRLRH